MTAGALSTIVLLMGVGSCGPSNHIESIDAAKDAHTEMIIPSPNCQFANTVCDDKRVHACVGGQVGDLLDICPDACSLGRCTSVSCAVAEHEDGTRGCRFYGVQMDNVDSDDSRKMMLILGNANTTPATAVVAASDSAGGWQPVTTAVVPPGGGARIEISRPPLESGVKTRAYRIDSDSPVLAVEIVSDDVDRGSRSSGGTVLRPRQVLGREHLAVTFPQVGTPGVLQTPGSRGGAGAIAIVATAAGTKVTIGLKTSAMFEPGGLMDPRPKPPVLMNEGDVLQIFSTTPDGDLTGTSIDADAPVAVFSGNIFTTYGYDITGFNGGDLAMEQLPPTANWSDEYIGAHLSSQSGCGSFFGPGAGRWSVIAAEDGTDVTVEPAAGVTIDALGLPGVTAFRLERGGVLSFIARSAPDASVPSDFVVQTMRAKPILLAQWLDCEPGLSWGIDTHFVSGDLAFAMPPGFDHELIVARKKGASVMFDGRLVDDTRFTSTLGRDFEVMRMSETELGRCGDLFDPCQHVLSGNVGIGWRGMDVVCSYALTVPPTKVCTLAGANCIK